MRNVQELSFEHVGFETPVRHPSGALGKATECGFRREAWAWGLLWSQLNAGGE